MGELPTTRDVTGGEDRRNGGAHSVVGGDAGTGIGRDADLVEPEPLNERRPAHGHEHQVGLDRLPFAVADEEARAGVVDPGALLFEMDGDAHGA